VLIIKSVTVSRQYCTSLVMKSPHW